MDFLGILDIDTLCLECYHHTNAWALQYFSYGCILSHRKAKISSDGGGLLATLDLMLDASASEASSQIEPYLLLHYRQFFVLRFSR